MKTFLLILLSLLFLGDWIVFPSAKGSGYCNNPNSTENGCCDGHVKVNISNEIICPPLCPDGCGKNEICGSPEKCVCIPGFIGSDCDFPIELKYENDKSHCGKPILQSYEVKKNWYCISSWVDCKRQKVYFLYSLEKHCCDGFEETPEKMCVENSN